MTREEALLKINELNTRCDNLMESNSKLSKALDELIYICETEDKLINCQSKEFISFKELLNGRDM